MHRYSIRVKGIRIISPLGWYPAEKALDNEFEVNVLMKVTKKDDSPVEQLSQTVDYALVYPIVKKCFETAQVQLIEHVVQQIGENILLQIEMVDKVRVEIKKLHPAMAPDIQSVSVKATFLRKFVV